MSKKRRYLISAAVLAVCVCIPLGVLAMLPPRPGVTKANFDRIEKGMTRVEVEAILGEPDSVSLNRTDACVDWNRPGRIWIWADFNIGNGELTDKANREWPETIPDKLRRWLHLP